MLAISRLSEVEVTSALARRLREGALPRERFDELLAGLDRDLSSFITVELTQTVLAKARALLLRHPLRAADALQLASALNLRDALELPLRMVAFDQRLASAAQGEGLEIF